MKRTACAALLMLSLGGCQGQSSRSFQGYVEGDYLRIGPTAGGELVAVNVTRGQQVEAGAPLFELDAQRETAALTESQARLDAAQARLSDLGKGKRSDELDVVRAQLQQARAQAALAASQLERQKGLRTRGLASQEQLDEARTAQAGSAARVRELEAALRSAELSARDDAVRATASDAKAAAAQVAQSQWQLAKRSQAAPVAGVIEDVYFRAGEFVGAGVPVVSLLPPANRKIRFFVPEATVGSLHAGQGISASCDGCAAPVAGKITFVATTAEFAPPIIYSRGQRERLMFLVEAAADPAAAAQLHPGQPLDVTLSP